MWLNVYRRDDLYIAYITHSDAWLLNYASIYVKVASRNRTLAHIHRFEKMADEVA